MGVFVGSLLLSAGTGAAQSLQASAMLSQNGAVWNYTLANQDANPGRSVNSFYLPLRSPIRNVVAPEGWTVDTDNRTFVLWSNSEASPYSHDIAPGASLSGFQFETAAPASSVSYELASWDHSLDASGPLASAAVQAPEAVYGDLNGDQQVNALDLTLALRFALGLDTPSSDQTEIGDVRPFPGVEIGRPFGDGQIGMDDLNWIARRVVNLTGTDPES